jgi:hypothetical protein
VHRKLRRPLGQGLNAAVVARVVPVVEELRVERQEEAVVSVVVVAEAAVPRPSRLRDGLMDGSC